MAGDEPIAFLLFISMSLTVVKVEQPVCHSGVFVHVCSPLMRSQSTCVAHFDNKGGEGVQCQFMFGDKN